MHSTRVGNYCIHVNRMGKLLPVLLKKGYSKVFLLTDSNSRELCYPLFRQRSNIEIDHIIEIPSGEEYKTLDSCELVWKQLLEQGADRSSLLINLGGGVVCDLGGFCASTYMRGFDFVQVPTTLLGQVDASVGGKVGIDFMDYKNLLGLFCDPREIYIEFDFLKSLPQRELQSGFVEVIKHALIESPGSWEKLRQKRPDSIDAMRPFIEKSLTIKKQVVTTDPYEAGLRKILNFGHTVGHAIETLYLKKDEPLQHGECVAAGIICESYISQKTYEFEQSLLDDISAFLLPYAERVIIEKAEYEQLTDLLKKDKKSRGGRVQFSLIKDVGAARYDIEVPKSLVIESFRYFRQLKGSTSDRHKEAMHGTQNK